MLEVYQKGRDFTSWSIEKSWENCHLDIKGDFQNISNRRTKRLIHPSYLRGFSSVMFSEGRSAGIWKGYIFLWKVYETGIPFLSKKVHDIKW